MAQRAYVRNNRGRFAGAGTGTKVTYGRAGGFANAAFRSRVAASRKAGKPGSGQTSARQRGAAFVKRHKKAIAVAGVATAAYGVSRVKVPVGRQGRPMSLGKIGIRATRKQINKTAPGRRVLGTGEFRRERVTLNGTTTRRRVGFAGVTNPNAPTRVAAPSFRRSGKGRAEAIPMGRNRNQSLRDIVRAQGAASARKAQPNYGLAKGRKEYVGRRVTDGNYGFVLRAKK